MNFAGHAAGGLAAGVAALGLAAAGEMAGLTHALPTLAGGGATAWGPGALLGGCFAVAFAMALFPDLDTASIPQRWYLRGLVLAMVLCLAEGARALFTVLAFAAPLPMLHKHRGWTHWPAAPWAIAVLLASAHEYVATEAAWFTRFSWGGVLDSLGAYWPFVLAAVLGHHTHLLLDGRLFRGLGLFRRRPGHH